MPGKRASERRGHRIDREHREDEQPGGAKPEKAKAPGRLAGSRVVVTGGAGFIGSHAVERLVREGAKVTVVDDFSSGRKDFLADVAGDIEVVKGDCGDAKVLAKALRGADSVWHLAANPEVRTGATDPAGHFDRNVVVTFAVLEGMRRAGVKHLAFTSTSTVYGRADVLPTPENYGPLLPISVYGAAKLSCEALIASYAGTFGFDAVLFRFANVVGPRSTHGVAFDFVNKLRKDPKTLEILGDGQQTKSYCSVADTVDGMVHAVKHAPSGVHPFNVGSLDAIPVTRIAEVVAEEMGIKPKHKFTGGTADGAGWKGDVKTMRLAIDRLQALGPGWAPKHDSEQAMRIAVRALVA
ncbi:MAG: NAD-dependent epimerase/dehydratase family protein [Candidatus Thermoplasmatota archaeon]